MRQELQEKEYDISWQQTPVIEGIGSSWHAPNRAQGFRTYFLPEGIRVVPRNEPEAWSWGLSLAGYGRGEDIRKTAKAALFTSGRRIEYRRTGIHEEYENTEQGLEQRFRLSGPPESGATQEVDRNEPVHLDMKIWGSLVPHISDDGRAIQFVSGSGAPAVHYAQLKVTDARGKELRAWMEGFAGPDAGGIRILIDASEASYPIVVDPLATTPSWTVLGGQSNARYGTVVATAGDVNGDGYSDVLVGAPYYDNGQTDEGRVYLYLGSAGGLSMTPAWTAELNQANALFGFSAATAGDVNGDGYSDVIAGAYLYLASPTNAGRVVVYLGSAAGLSTTPNWTVDGQPFGFGYSVSTAGDVNDDGYSDVIIGQVDTAAYVYLGSSSGLAGTPASTVIRETPFTQYAERVAPAGDVNGDGYADVLVADTQFTNGESVEGKVYLYLGTSTGINTTPAWTAEGNQANAHLGSGLATAGDVNGDGYADVVTGAYGYTFNGLQGGQAAVYLGSAAGLATTPAWTFNGNQSGAFVGVAVSTAGDVNGDGYADVVIGAYGYSNPETNEGRAYVFLGFASGLRPSPGWTAESNSANALFGGAVSTAGDVNGDGYADVLVGAPYYDGAATDQGAAFLYLGSASGPAFGPGWSITETEQDADFGWSAASAGDVNGDGYADVIVGSPTYDNGQTDEGRALLYLGGPAGLSTTPAWSAEGNQNEIDFGFSVASAGDVNRDGYSDVIIGASGETPYGPKNFFVGRAYVYLGSPLGLAANPVWTASGDQEFDLFGGCVASAGDVNGDGYADVIVGAEQYSNDLLYEGRAYLYLGSPSGPAATPSWMAEGNRTNAYLGHSVASAGDVNRDGYSDVVVGAYGYNDSVSFKGGIVSLYLGSPSGLGTSPSQTEGSVTAGDAFGYSVAGAGDVNGDGYSDVIVGSPFWAGGAGDATLYLGSASGVLMWSWSNHGNAPGDFYGLPVGPAGDVNGDGYADVVIAAAEYYDTVYLGSASGLANAPAWNVPSFDDSLAAAGDVNGDGYADIVTGAAFAGEAHLYYGNGGPGLSFNTRQRQSDGSGPIAPAGRSNAPGSFTLQTTGRMPFGRSDVRLEWEIKPLGMPLNGATVLTTDDASDTGTTGVDLSATPVGLNPGFYHWRLRLRYDSAKSPFAQHSRWITIPWHGWQEAHLTLGAFLGGWVWDDLDGDGVREGGEPGHAGATVLLANSSGMIVGQKTTLGDGYYSFELPGAGASFRLQLQPPAGTSLTLQDQGDDLLDSDPDPATGLTPLIGLAFLYLDDLRWGAGLKFNPPVLPVSISGVRTVAGSSNLILDISDPNSLSQVTGYNVYRSSQPQPPPAPWTLLGSDVTDNDPATPNIQWTDTTGDTPAPGTVFYYQVTAFNHYLNAEGPR